MKLREVLAGGAEGVEITGLAYDSRRVTPGTLFFAVPGFQYDGHDFAPEAVGRGAAALVVERPLGLGVPEIVVGSVREAMGPAAARFHGDPSAELAVVAVTGTNGKTTVTRLVAHMYETAHRVVGMTSTEGTYIGGELVIEGDCSGPRSARSRSASSPQTRVACEFRLAGRGAQYRSRLTPGGAGRRRP